LGTSAEIVAMKLLGQLRSAGIGADLALDGRSIKAAMKNADKSGAKFAVLIGDEELASDNAVVKNLETGDQVTVALDLVINHLSK
jgi:histidyl-tRNA synthetase